MGGEGAWRAMGGRLDPHSLESYRQRFKDTALGKFVFITDPRK